MKASNYIGLMSGTSLDGIDAVVVNFADGVNVVETIFHAYPESLKKTLLKLQHPSENELQTTALVSNDLANLYAQAVNDLLNKANLSPEMITAIGSHGQTIRHQPVFDNDIGFSLQIGNAALLSELTNITVVSDFRTRDIAAGGQGAPLVPAFHESVFSSENHNRAIINIGGIANITYLPKRAATNADQVFGFDSGPGNMLIDFWIKKHLNADYDDNGQWSRTGQCITALLSNFMRDDFFSAPLPKSTGRDLFHQNWLADHLRGTNYAAQDVACTLVTLTAHSIASALKQHCGDTEEVYLCGGGTHNQFLVDTLKHAIKNNVTSVSKVKNTSHLNIDVDWVEAVAFAWLAKKCINGETASIPRVTGASGARILGTITQS